MPNHSATDLLIAGWERVYLTRTKHGNTLWAWRHIDWPGDHSYHNAISILKDVELGKSRKTRKRKMVVMSQ